jgi:hypothetical protein
MIAIASSKYRDDCALHHDALAATAYNMADAMMTVREGSNTTPDNPAEGGMG